jgi:hypothetical protein
MGKIIPPTSPDAPRFDGSPETLLEYLNHVRTLCTTANASEGMLIRYTIACAAQSAPDEALSYAGNTSLTHTNVTVTIGISFT